jgi:hypothetical protein
MKSRCNTFIRRNSLYHVNNSCPIRPQIRSKFMVSSMSRVAATAWGFATATLLAGCSAPNTPVTGTVTVDARPVRAGQLTFVGGPKGEKYITVIGFDGKYTIELPAGEYKVGVEGDGGQTAAAKMAKVPVPAPPKGVPVMKDPTGQVPGEGVNMAKESQNPVVVPMKYRPAESSGFGVTVPTKGGSYDIAMKSQN